MRNLGFAKLESATVARLARATMMELNCQTNALTPEDDGLARHWQHEFNKGLVDSGVMQDIVHGVAEAAHDQPAQRKLELIVRIAIRFGVRLQQSIERFDAQQGPAEHCNRRAIGNSHHTGAGRTNE